MKIRIKKHENCNERKKSIENKINCLFNENEVKYIVKNRNQRQLVHIEGVSTIL